VAAETSSSGNVRVHWLEEGKLVTVPFGAQARPRLPAKDEDSHPIAQKLVATITKEVRSKVVNLESGIAGRAAAEELQRTVVTKEGLAGFHPAHAAYVFAQNQVSVMSEQLTALPELAPFADIVSKAEDRYLPSGPPMSPLTPSYFTCWAFFDACVEPANETIGTTILEVGSAFGMPAELLRLIRLMQASRMGLYVHEARRPASSFSGSSPPTPCAAPSSPPATAARGASFGTPGCFHRPSPVPRSTWSSRRRMSS